MRSLFTLIALGTCFSAAFDVDAGAASSVRKSINFGPIHAPSSSAAMDTAAIERFNQQAKVAAYDSDCVDRKGLSAAECLGSSLAASFVASLHPLLEFTLVDGFLSRNSLVYHAHFLRSVNGIPVANGNLNVNVDTRTGGHIVTYYDNTLDGSSNAAAAVLSKQRMNAWAPKVVNQIIFGAPPPPAAFSAHAYRPTAADTNDPRQGLLTFLAIAADDSTSDLIAASSSRSALINSMQLSGSIDDDDRTITISNVPSTLSPVSASLAYLHDGTSMRLTWKYIIESNDNYYEAYVAADPSAVAGEEEVMSSIDWVRDYRPTGGELGIEALSMGKDLLKMKSTTMQKGRIPRKPDMPHAPTPSPPSPPKSKASPEYRVFPWGTNDPSEGKRHLLKGTLVEIDSAASPSGWHTVPAASVGGREIYYDDTRGNNVMAQDNVDGGNQYLHNYRPTGGANMSFDYHLGLPRAGTPLEPRAYINASITELFYTCNEIHDLFYRYGFDEVSGNFQEANFDRGGRGSDAVQANAQDGSGFNNANFATPPDGSRPRMRMYVWNQQQPYRDGDLEAGIVIHEYAHGISTRLTGGPANSGCLGWGEAGGMGEGWGDFFATMIRMSSPNETEFAMGEWASGRASGIRNFRYSTNMTVNTDTYSSLDKPGYFGVHAVGEVWAEMLFEVAELLIGEHGFEKSLFPPALDIKDVTGFYDTKYPNAKVATRGNTLAVQLVVDGLKLQPCRPSFIDARDSILTADKVLTGGDNACLIWKGFAKRGLGAGAELIGIPPWAGKRKEDYTLPKECR